LIGSEGSLQAQKSINIGNNLKTEFEALPNESLLRILELTQKLASPFELSHMLEEVLQAGLDVMEADSGSLWLYNEAYDTLEMYLPDTEPRTSLKNGKGLVGECLAKNEIINIKDCYTDPRFNPDIDGKTGYKTNSILCIPLVGFDKSLVGVLQLLNKETGHFTDQDKSLAFDRIELPSIRP